MAKNTTVFVCNSCGYESSKWLGKCPGCNGWNTFYEEKVLKNSKGTEKTRKQVEAKKLNSVEKKDVLRLKIMDKTK